MASTDASVAAMFHSTGNVLSVSMPVPTRRSKEADPPLRESAPPFDLKFERSSSPEESQEMDFDDSGGRKSERKEESNVGDEMGGREVLEREKELDSEKEREKTKEKEKSEKDRRKTRNSLKSFHHEKKKKKEKEKEKEKDKDVHKEKHRLSLAKE